MNFRVTAFVNDGLQTVDMVALDEATAWETMAQILGSYGEIVDISHSHMAHGE